MTATMVRHAGVTAKLDDRAEGGGSSARRAVLRWAWRLFVREWRQQFLIMALVAVAVAATVVGSAVAVNSSEPAHFGFGTARDLVSFQAASHQESSEIASLASDEGPIQIVTNETMNVPGSVDTFELRAESPHGRFTAPMLSLVRGRYPAVAGQVAMTQTVASELHVSMGGVWRQGGADRRLVGIVENPQSLLDDFALVVPGQVSAPTLVTVLFDAHQGSQLPPNVASVASVAKSGVFNPETISIAGLTIGMLLIALVAVGGFTVLAQRRLRSLGMLESMGATDAHVNLVVRANGVFVGAIGAGLGAVLGVAVWLLYRPHLELSAHHVIPTFALPWPVVVASVLLAVVATYVAARRPAARITRVPIMDALSGRPPAPAQLRRSALPGIVCSVLAFLILGYAGASGGIGGGTLIAGLVLLVAGLILISPFFLAVMGALARAVPVSMRIALRDLSRYRVRSGAALSAISLSLFIAMVINLAAVARYSNVLDYAGPNLTSGQLVVYSENGSSSSNAPGTSASPALSTAQLAKISDAAHRIGAEIGAGRVVELLSTSASLLRAAPGQNFHGPLYVATPQLLSAFGVSPSRIQSDTDILTMRPGLASVTKMQLVFGRFRSSDPHNRTSDTFPCPKNACIANPAIQEMPALPSGTSAPNTVITEETVERLGLRTVVSGWLFQGYRGITAEQISNAQDIAVSAGMRIETKNSQPTSAELMDYTTIFGTLLALAILAMSVGLIRSETASDLRVLSASGARSATRRSITATTTGALAFAGAVLGTGTAYLALIGYLRSDTFNGGLTALGSVPGWDLVGVLVIMPLVAAFGGWILGGRQPPAIGRQPIE